MRSYLPILLGSLLLSACIAQRQIQPLPENPPQPAPSLTESSRSATPTARESSRSVHQSSASSRTARSTVVANSSSLPSATEVMMPTAPKELHIPILVYHHIRPQEGWAKSTWSWKMTVSPITFDTQMQWLKDHNYTTITLDMLVEILEGRQVGPAKPIVITFDDNQLNSYENGVPVLEKYGQTAVFYLVANRLDQPDVINRDRALDLLARGMDIQSHTMTHADLTNLSIAQLDWQLSESKRILEELTGKPIRHIAYPLTAHNSTVREHTKAAGYVTGTIMDPRPIPKNFDLFKLPRIMMTDDTELEKVLP